MFLKDYQVKVVTELQDFFRKANELRTALQKANKLLPEDLKSAFDYVEKTFEKLGKEYRDHCKNGLGEHYSRIIIKVPTGGGKTLLAVEAIREYQNIFAQKRTGLVVWIVPSETIYSQTVKKLRDKANPLRQLLDQASGNRTLILEKGQRLTTGDIEDNLVILFIIIQSISRINAKEALKVFQDSGGFESFFPADNRFDLHAKLVNKCPNLDLLSEIGPIIKTSLGNAVRLSKPFIIIDEIHKVFSPMARKTIDNLNPEIVLGLTATPKREMNILVSITGLQLKDEDMVKLDMHIIPPSGRTDNDWKSMLKEIKDRRDTLEMKAAEYRQDTGVYIRPMALIQVEATGKEQRGKGRVHSLDVKELLQELEINPDEIAIKTSAQNDIEDVDLFSQECNIRYLITKEALREGWDCSFAYILGIIPNVCSNTGVTQIIGRILRQPFARKTGVPHLDESYVYYSKGGTREILDRVAIGFRNEGLEDLVTSVKIQDNENVNPTKKVSIRKDLKSKYENELYLPVWVMIEKADKIRRFSYDLDIKPYISFSSYQMNNSILKRLQGLLSKETQERQSIIVTLDKESKFAIKAEQSGSDTSAGEIRIEYLTRRYSEIVENPFLARKLAAIHLEYLIQGLGIKKVEENFGYITSFLCRELSDEKAKIEEYLFKDYLKNHKIKLAVSINSKLGYKIPEEEMITVSRAQNPYNNYLFEDIELSSLNSLEKKVGDIFDKQEKILWWFRNKVNRNGYSIQGWRKYKIRPDFVAAKKNDNGNLELVYIIESKGQMLVGNSDTLYKKNVLDLMTDQKKKHFTTKNRWIYRSDKSMKV
jgi:type III restriction enzyme